MSLHQGGAYPKPYNLPSQDSVLASKNKSVTLKTNGSLCKYLTKPCVPPNFAMCFPIFQKSHHQPKKSYSENLGFWNLSKHVKMRLLALHWESLTLTSHIGASLEGWAHATPAFLCVDGVILPFAQTNAHFHFLRTGTATRWIWEAICHFEIKGNIQHLSNDGHTTHPFANPFTKKTQTTFFPRFPQMFPKSSIMWPYNIHPIPQHSIVEMARRWVLVLWAAVRQAAGIFTGHRGACSNAWNFVGPGPPGVLKKTWQIAPIFLNNHLKQT